MDDDLRLDKTLQNLRMSRKFLSQSTRLMGYDDELIRSTGARMLKSRELIARADRTLRERLRNGSACMRGQQACERPGIPEAGGVNASDLPALAQTRVQKLRTDQAGRGQAARCLRRGAATLEM